jgi:septal ring-binding cell division protein DamX
VHCGPRDAFREVTKGESDVEPQNPGPKPPNQSSEPPKTEPGSAWISPRLREKLGETESDEPSQKQSPVLAIILLVLVVGGGLGLLLAIRSSSERTKAEALHKAQVAAAESTATARADSLKKVTADSLAAIAAAEAATPAGKKKAAKAAAEKAAAEKAAARQAAKTAAAAPAAKPKTPVAAGGTAPAAKSAPAAPAAGAAAAPAPAAPKGPFGIDVGSYLAEDRATSEQARLTAATGLAGRVVTEADGSFHVVLGSFASRAGAEKASDPLLAKNLVNQALVVPLKH